MALYNLVWIPSFCSFLKIFFFFLMWTIFKVFIEFVTILLLAQMVKTSCNAGDSGWIPGWGRSPGEGTSYPLQYSCLESSMDRGAWGALVHGVTKRQTHPSGSHFHLLLFYVFFFWQWGMWDLSAPIRDWTHTPCTGRQSPNPWVTGGVPLFCIFNRIVAFLLLSQLEPHWPPCRTSCSFATFSCSFAANALLQDTCMADSFSFNFLLLLSETHFD